MGQKITDYSSVSSANPDKLSLIDISELLPNTTFSSRKMSLQQLINYINPIPYPSITMLITGMSTFNPQLAIIKNTIDTTNPTMSTFTNGQLQTHTISHSSFSNNAVNSLIVHSGITLNDDGTAHVYATTNGELSVKTFRNGLQNSDAMKQIVITYYKLV